MMVLDQLQAEDLIQKNPEGLTFGISLTTLSINLLMNISFLDVN